MRLCTAAFVLPILAACMPEAPVAVAAPPPVPVPAGCTIDPATRLAISALPLNEVIASASTFGLPANDVIRLFSVRDGGATPADVAYVRGCLGVNI